MWLGVTFGLGCFALFARNAHWDEIGPVLADASVPLIALASGCLFMTSVVRALRWRHLLRDAPVSFRHRLTSSLIGFAGNNVLPGRLGEPLRCWVISRLDRGIAFWQAAGSIVVERVFDLAATILLLVIFLILAPVSSDAAASLARLREEAALVGAVLVVVVIALAFFARRRFGDGERRYARLGARLVSLQKGFAGLRSGRAMTLSALYTVVLWTFMVLFELLMLRAFGFAELGLPEAIGLLVVLAFAIALPQAPAGVGVVQLASETTLTALYDMPLARAKAFAIGLWVCQVTVVVGAGAIALWFEGLSLADMQRARGSIDDLQTAPSPDQADTSGTPVRKQFPDTV